MGGNTIWFSAVLSLSYMKGGKNARVSQKKERRREKKFSGTPVSAKRKGDRTGAASFSSWKGRN